MREKKRIIRICFKLVQDHGDHLSFEIIFYRFCGQMTEYGGHFDRRQSSLQHCIDELDAPGGIFGRNSDLQRADVTTILPEIEGFEDFL